VYVAGELPLARGWERQLDIGRNAIFYADDLDVDAYHRWLRDNAVAFVALADAPPDPSAHAEAELVRRRLPFLEPVWHDEHCAVPSNSRSMWRSRAAATEWSAWLVCSRTASATRTSSTCGQRRPIVGEASHPR